MVPQGAEPPSKKRKRSFGISEQGKREPLDGWTAEEVSIIHKNNILLLLHDETTTTLL